MEAGGELGSGTRWPEFQAQAVDQRDSLSRNNTLPDERKEEMGWAPRKAAETGRLCDDAMIPFGRGWEPGSLGSGPELLCDFRQPCDSLSPLPPVMCERLSEVPPTVASVDPGQALPLSWPSWSSCVSVTPPLDQNWARWQRGWVWAGGDWVPVSGRLLVF